ncbi:MAG TPA: MFS transporter, partial [Miltoncostaeaceae bacterium]|nr:MFS transporter [Miltoncostaeaceae bacterium]
GVAFCLALPLPLLSPDLFLVSLSLLLFGACNATLDVSMNAQAVAVEESYRRAIMSSFHGLFSLGGLAGAAVAGAVLAAGVPALAHLVTVAAGSVIALVCCQGSLMPSASRDVPPDRVFARPTGILLGLGILAFCGLLAEGAMGDWSAVYLHDTLGSSPAVAAAGFAAFSLAMAAGRFAGDPLVARFGSASVLRHSSAIAAVGLAAALASGRPVPGIVGCALVGLGIANVIPILFSAAGRVPGVQPGTALAAVATTGYCGLLAGPPLIGLAAEIGGLRVALGIVSVLCGLVALGAGVTGRPAAPDADRVTMRAEVTGSEAG